MSWKSEMGMIVRYMVDDVSSTPTYPDERIETTILVAAQLIQTEVNFENDYVIRVEGGTLSPDPTLLSDRDDGFINLTTLKAACIIIGAEYKAQGLSSVKVNDGPSSIDLSTSASHMKALWSELCSRYEDYKMNFAASNNNVGKAVLSPYGSWYFNSPSSRNRD